jgi:hypothetical protein
MCGTTWGCMGRTIGTTFRTFDKENGMDLKDIWQRKWDKFKEHVWENIWELWEKHREYGLQYCEDMGEKNP